MAGTTSHSAHEQIIKIDVGVGSIEGSLIIPEVAQGVILFAHGSGSSRHSSRNKFVASQLQRLGFGTLLIDLLTAHEEQIDVRTAQIRFDIGLLATRVVGATDWLAANAATKNLPLGYFGASTGAAAALVAAARRQEAMAVVSRGGRPDLADEALPQVRAATLLIVGALDFQVIELNRQAYDRLSQAPEKQIQIVPGATHLFEEPGTLEKVVQLAGEWFSRHLTGIGDRVMAGR
jgi:putative phosphoribosyl transferase